MLRMLHWAAWWTRAEGLVRAVSVIPARGVEWGGLQHTGEKVVCLG